MGLRSELFKGDARLAACQVDDASHILLGAVGAHVAKIQMALFVNDGLGVDAVDRTLKRYGPSTAQAVLAFKAKRGIVNHAYQTAPDDIVGKMTITALDDEVAEKEQLHGGRKPICCGNDRELRGERDARAPVSSIVPKAGSVARLRFAVVDPPGSKASPRVDAMSSVPAAVKLVTATRGILAALKATAAHPGPQPLPKLVLQRFDKVWAHFGVPKGLPVLGPFGQVTDLQSFLDTIDKTYEKVEGFLRNAANVLRDLIAPLPANSTYAGPDTRAFTLDKDRAVFDPTGPDFPDGIYIKAEFTKLGPRKKAEMLVHEPVHLIGSQTFQDVRKPWEPDYKTISLNGHLTNAWSYSQFVLDVLFDRDMPFELNE